MEKFGRKRIFEGSLRELVEMSVQEETVCAVEKLRNSSVQKEERWLRGYEKENLADSLISWDYVFDFLYVTPWTESVRNLSGSKKYVSSVPDCSGRTGVIFVCAEGSMIWYLLTSMRKKQTARQQFSVLLEKKRYVLCGVVSNIRLLDFLFGHHTIRNRWAAGAALLYEQRWKQRF